MKILVANRGEIAIRIMRACRELGCTSVAVYSEADAGALHTRYADEACLIGPAGATESYLNIDNIIAAALEKGVDAIHPGYGFLSENTEFANRVEEAGMVFIGPRPETIAKTGDKLVARAIARKAGLPVLSGPDIPIGEDQDVELERILAEHQDYPVMVKAISGGGGRGIRLANNPYELKEMIELARKESKTSFGDDGIYLEPFVDFARHIEVQIIGDGQGNILVLGERECSIQRRHQKLIEEAPAPNLSSDQREQVHCFARQLGEQMLYRSLGTVEFLLDRNGNFYFIEVNPRIQVEHPVTEVIFGVDLVRMQIKLAFEGQLPYSQEQLMMRGAAIEARILAEDSTNNFMPVTGKITYIHEPDGPGVRVDSALFQGMEITTDYDSMIAKLIVWGEDREAAIDRLTRALKEFQVSGVPTTREFLAEIIAQEKFIRGTVDTTFLNSFKPVPQKHTEAMEKIAALATALALHHKKQRQQQVQKVKANNWRKAAWQEQMRGTI
jgi:acetyl-CoA carboxylase biotin carboxylase subunit